MRVLFFGTYDEARHPRVRVLREGLAAFELEVDQLNRPLGDSTADRVAAARNPMGALRWIGRLGRAWISLLLGSRGVRRPDVIVVGYLGVLDVLVARLRWPRAFVVLDHMAPLSGVAVDRGLPRAVGWVLGWVDRVAERTADLVLFDTDENAALSPTSARKKMVVAVGATDDWYSVDAKPRADADPVEVVFFGLYTPLQGTPTIGAAIGLLNSHPIRFTMIGTGQDHAATVEAAGSDALVTWIEWVPATDLPGLVAGHDVCLGSFGTTAKALRVVPNKIFQGAAAGCALVTSNSGPQRSALGDAAQYVEPGDPEALASALAAFAADREALALSKARARARGESWRSEEVVVPLLEAMRLGLR